MTQESQPSTGLISRLEAGVFQRRKAGLFDFAGVHPLLRPALRAFLLGYASAVSPRILSLLFQHLSGRRKKSSSVSEDDKSLVDSLAHTARVGLEPQRFAAFCAVLIGGNSLFLVPILRIVNKFSTSVSRSNRIRLARWLAAFISGWLSLSLLQSKKTTSRKPRETEQDGFADGKKSQVASLGGRTIDLTLFTVTQALDVLVGELWFQHKVRRVGARKWTKIEEFISNSIDPTVFAVSSAFIMWSWFYHPDRLPSSYNKWITSAASVDFRLIKVLRQFRFGKLEYGKDNGEGHILESMCVDYDLPRSWGDPAKSVPFRCDLVHMKSGPSCEYHAVSRFIRSWKWSMYTYLPLALVIKMRKPSRRALVQAIISASRSSAFLATFITLCYYGICLARTRIGPHVIGKDAACRQRIDGGICISTCCSLCGWSVLLETASRRKDMALFVAPRALGTVVPRQYSRDKQWRETAAFAASAAVVLTCYVEQPKRIRGVLGGVLRMVT